MQEPLSDASIRSMLPFARFPPILADCADRSGRVRTPGQPLSDRLARRTLPVDFAPIERRARLEGPLSRGTSDANVQPAVAVPPVQGSGAGTPSDRSSALPPALVGPPRRQDSDRAHPTTISLPNDSDDATLDAISTNGKPVSLPEAIKLAFRHQPRLRAQLESISQARGLEQIAFSTFLPIVGANHDVGDLSLGLAEHRSASRRDSRASASYREWERCPLA